MGTTCTALLSAPRALFCAVGDSRLYLVRGAHISRLDEGPLLLAGWWSRAWCVPRMPRSIRSGTILTAALGAGLEVAAGKPRNGVWLCMISGRLLFMYGWSGWAW